MTKWVGLIQPKHTDVSLTAYVCVCGNKVKSTWIRCSHALDANLSVENFSFCQNKFANVGSFRPFLLFRSCKNHSVPSVVHRNKLE